MKVFLTQSIKGIGRAGEVKDFPQGYAQNFIIKKGYGIVATDKVMTQALDKKIHDQKEADISKKKLVDSVLLAKNLIIEIKAPSNEYGVLFSSIQKKDILLEIKKRLAAPITESMIEFKEPIKSVGKHKFNLSYDIYSSEITIDVLKK